MSNYVLDENNNPVKEPDLMKWAAWFEKAGKHVAKTKVNGRLVSTVFLGIDHGFMMRKDDPDYKPVLWETMVFADENCKTLPDGDPWRYFQDRYTSHKSALLGHDKVVMAIQEGKKTEDY